MAAAALLGQTAGEEFAKQAGSAAWQVVRSLAEAIRAKLSPRGVAALEQIDGAGAEAIVADEVRSAAETDPAFRNLVEDLLAQAKATIGVAAVARDNAKQVNFGGDNHGTINL
ncbi:hypothetical protein [Dactylosporangium sp. CA-139066]|uniref:hypothetical protein n=1 Tax=Dactylosporangium sp. CA-139066 TaxID=3239930 RepID=UPI003D93E099